MAYPDHVGKPKCMPYPVWIEPSSYQATLVIRQYMKVFDNLKTVDVWTAIQGIVATQFIHSSE